MCPAGACSSQACDTQCMCLAGLLLAPPYLTDCLQGMEGILGSSWHCSSLPAPHLVGWKGPRVLSSDSRELKPHTQACTHVSCLLGPHCCPFSPRQLCLHSTAPKPPGAHDCWARWPLPPRHPARSCIPSSLPLAAPYPWNSGHPGRMAPGRSWTLCLIGWQSATPSPAITEPLGAWPVSLTLHCDQGLSGSQESVSPYSRCA